MPVILLVVIGALAGVLATRLMRMDTDLPTAMVIGVLGAVVGGMGFRFMMTSASWVGAFVLALLGSLVLLWLWQQYQGRR
ncbi:GlsB/YeaQ/YmgE family stress response membrane protein [Roseinatronobacter bogoriensis]|uniref:GlsB/YeaQ/YmgE family stress response membrane protein n=1 Tax=Roseinatronobacter bogoriensis subsp. barguzinensis TaxID=441209 RepID=A0A2K8KAN8_9RHOB|nr:MULTISPECIES: GlsB/YeaQ/YmgE family stress response membrane protein [Rhodobaca]ATX66484.1 GlsB/YeaQ/YmgE family stress response membrane protein [Rhodobaca barguzinensis]MBB4207637.1 putative membrane protein YeaQ/YmgE (transglycosylase-associated protein family) [Rhodobaca bogoriensis DSM 18756]TDW40056.1 transglycosylase associated protein [Rhodobaca barguzinensis]TDY70791.1 transglycosylase associated protein [Rhodobaca bogoriensis DSM 18756]